MLSTTTGVAPLSNASTSSRSSRRTFGPLVRDWTISTTSTLAATTCGPRAAPSMGSPRVNDRAPGQHRRRPGRSSTSTQSPVATCSSPGVARTVPSAMRTVTRPMSTRATRPGAAVGRPASSTSAASPASHPSASSASSCPIIHPDQRTLGPCVPRSHCSLAISGCATTLCWRAHMPPPIASCRCSCWTTALLRDVARAPESLRVSRRVAARSRPVVARTRQRFVRPARRLGRGGPARRQGSERVVDPRRSRTSAATRKRAPRDCKPPPRWT